MKVRTLFVFVLFAAVPCLFGQEAAVVFSNQSDASAGFRLDVAPIFGGKSLNGYPRTFTVRPKSKVQIRIRLPKQSGWHGIIEGLGNSEINGGTGIFWTKKLTFELESGRIEFDVRVRDASGQDQEARQKRPGHEEPKARSRGELFRLTAKVHPENSDWERAVRAEFGRGYRVAEWSDLVKLYERDGIDGLAEVLDSLGLANYGKNGDSGAFVLHKGKKTAGAGRWYFVARFNRNQPSGFLAHENIDRRFLSLGSWKGERKILAVKTDF